MFTFGKLRTKAPARAQLQLRGVRDDVLLLPKRQYRVILEASPINFELKSDDEQDILIDTYESFLNALPCPVQIVVRIRELDMDQYVASLSEQQRAEPNAIYRGQLKHYRSFVQKLVSHNHILSRQFYVVLPYGASDDDFDTAKEQLRLITDLVGKGLAQLGVRTRQLTSLEILDLLQSFYNPAVAKQQPISEQVTQLLEHPYVRGQR